MAGSIEYIKGNLFTTTAPIIAHGCNAQGVMGSGVAKEIKTLYPEAYQMYVDSYNSYGLVLGSVLFAKSNQRVIANCITQQYYGRTGNRYVNYGAIANCLTAISIYAKFNQLSTVAMPTIGCGLGGGKWNIIKELVEQILAQNLAVEVYEI